MTKGRSVPPKAPEIVIEIDPAQLDAHAYAYLGRALHGDVTDPETLELLARLLTVKEEVEDFPLDNLADVMEQLSTGAAKALRTRLAGKLTFRDLRILAPARKGALDVEGAVDIARRIGFDTEDLDERDLIALLRFIDLVQRRPKEGKEKN